MLEDLPIADLRIFLAKINSTYNYDFGDYAMSSFKRRIITILNERNLSSCNDLLDIICASEANFKVFLSDLTVNTTEMFRDPTFWKYLKKDIFPTIRKSKIKIWHAGCSSGEEVFSMAILLEEAGIYDNVEITATDISSTILEKAKTGVYSLSKQETNMKNYEAFEGKKKLDEYYKLDGRKVTFDSKLLRNVKFKEHNLAKGEDSHFDNFDIILCRNVMIYFNSNLQDEVYKLFHKSLNTNGIIAIGVRESMIWSSINNKYNCLNTSEKVYKKITE